MPVGSSVVETIHRLGLARETRLYRGEFLCHCTAFGMCIRGFVQASSVYRVSPHSFAYREERLGNTVHLNVCAQSDLLSNM